MAMSRRDEAIWNDVETTYSEVAAALKAAIEGAELADEVKVVTRLDLSMLGLMLQPSWTETYLAEPGYLRVPHRWHPGHRSVFFQHQIPTESFRQPDEEPYRWWIARQVAGVSPDDGSDPPRYRARIDGDAVVLDLVGVDLDDDVAACTNVAPREDPAGERIAAAFARLAADSAMLGRVIELVEGAN